MNKLRIVSSIVVASSLIVVSSVFLNADKNSGSSSYYKEKVGSRVYKEDTIYAYLYPEDYSLRYVEDYEDPDLGKVTAFALDKDLFKNTVSFFTGYDKVYVNNTTKQESRAVETESLTEGYETPSETENESENIFEVYSETEDLLSNETESEITQESISEKETENTVNETLTEVETEPETENTIESDINSELLKKYDEPFKGSENPSLGPISLLFGGEIDSAVIHFLNEETYKEGEYYPFLVVSNFVRYLNDTYYFYYMKGEFISYDLSINIKTGEMTIEQNAYSKRDINEIYFNFIDIPIEEEFPPSPEYEIDYDTQEESTEEITEVEGTNFDEVEDMFDDDSLSDENGEFDEMEEYEDNEEYTPEDNYELLEPVEAIIGTDNYLDLIDILYKSKVYEAEFYTTTTIDQYTVYVYMKTNKGYLKMLYTPEDKEINVYFDNFMNTASMLRSLEEDYDKTEF